MRNRYENATASMRRKCDIMTIETSLMRTTNEIVQKIDNYFSFKQHKFYVKCGKNGEYRMAPKCNVEYTENGDYEIKIPIPFPLIEVVITKCESGRYVDISNNMFDSDITICFYRNEQLVCAFNEAFLSTCIDTIISFIDYIVKNYSDYDDEHEIIWVE